MRASILSAAAIAAVSLPLLYLITPAAPATPSPQGNMQYQPVCAEVVRDQTTGNCIPADSTPTLGSLYPLSADLYMDLGGRVGMGTTGPLARLHVLQPEDELGLVAEKTLATGLLPALRGVSASETSGALAVEGRLSATTPGPDATAVRGASAGIGSSGIGGKFTHDAAGWGLLALAPDGDAARAVTTTGIAVNAFASTGTPIQASRSSSTGTTPAIFGRSYSTASGAVAIRGHLAASEPGCDAAAVEGLSNGSGFCGIGVRGSHNGNGWGTVGSVLNATSGSGVGVRGYAASAGWAVYAAGNLGASGTKSFVQPHPTDPAKELRFFSLEGDESGTYFRGTARLVDGTATIEVPEVFRLVSEPQGLSTQVTPRGPAMVWVEEESLERIVVRGDADVEFHYLVNGVRRGFADVELVQENWAFRPRERGVPFGAELPPAARKLLVDNGTLHPDFTPNEDTAARHGWQLVDPAPRSKAPSLSDLPERPELQEQSVVRR